MTLMGSIAYGVSSDSSDNDVYGCCIPKKEVVFPHTSGYIQGFDSQIPKFEQWTKHHVLEKDHKKEWDFSIYGIIKYFRLCADCNPNMIDSLYTPQTCILYMNPVGQIIRENRHLFLSKKCWHTFKGYAYSQLHKIRTKAANKSGRQELIEKHGYDTKFAYHVIRLVGEVEQMMAEGDLNLLTNREQLKSIRRGEWTIEDIENYYKEAEVRLNKLYTESKALPHKIREKEIKQVLINCLEHHFSTLENCVATVSEDTLKLSQIKQILER